MSIQQRFEQLQQRVARAAQRAGRQPQSVCVLAASKTQSAARINAAIAAGIRIIGENRVQEAASKFDQLSPVRKHLIGHLQSNKAKAAVQLFDCIESLDRWALAQRLDGQARKLDKRLSVLIEVNAAAEASKSGVAVSECLSLARKVSRCEHLLVQGLMIIPPFTRDAEINRPHFKTACTLYNELATLPGVQAAYLSMGTSQDFEVAIEEGASLVRVGTVLFGPRNPSKE